MSNQNNNIYFLNHRRSYAFKNSENTIFMLNNAQSFNFKMGDFKSKKNWNTGFSFSYFIKNFNRSDLKYPYPTELRATTAGFLMQSLKCLSSSGPHQKIFSSSWGYIISPRRGGFIVSALGFIGFLPKTQGLHLYLNYHFLYKKNYPLFSTLNQTTNLWAPLMFPCHLLSAIQENPLRKNVRLLRFKYIFTVHSRLFLAKVENKIASIESLHQKPLRNKSSTQNKLDSQTTLNQLKKNNVNKKNYKN